MHFWWWSVYSCYLLLYVPVDMLSDALTAVIKYYF